MNANLHLPSPASQHGVVLLEAMISILIFSIGILGIVGLQAAMVKSTSDAKYRADAAFAAQQMLGRIWADPSNLNNYLEAGTDISASTGLPNGTRTVSQLTPGQMQIQVTWQQPGQTEVHNVTLNARICSATPPC